MVSRRSFLKLGAAAGAGLFAAGRGATRSALAQAPLLLDPLTQPKFVNPLPNPLDPGFIFQPTTPGGTHYEIGMYQFQQPLGLVDPLTNTPLMTTVWGYGSATQAPTYPGRTFIAQSGQQMTVRWTNNLVDGGGSPLPHLLPVDTSLHMAKPAAGVPVVSHVHGGHTESDSDGLPEYWFTPGFAEVGPRWVKETYVYDNDQEAGTVWYHDHALGITRLNVYAGLAGFFLIRDDNEAAVGLPQFPYEVPIVIQDRMFTADGQLFYPSAPVVLGSPDPSVLPEFFGDHILVNGQAWPVLDVEPRWYRLRFLNGSDSRFYNLFLSSGQVFFQIGTDTGLLNTPIPVQQLTIGPGERADVMVDFSAFAGQTIILRNNAKSPFPKGVTADPQTTGQIMAFRVGATVTDATNNALPANLRPLHGGIQPLATAGPVTRVRQLILFEGLDMYGRLQPMLGTVADGTLLWDEDYTETPSVGDIEIWEVYNATMDAHPIHLHLVSFQILSRQKYSATITPKPMMHGSTGGFLTNIKLKGRPKGPAANEAGWKDTAQMFPGEVTRVIARFDRPGRYVWHCHILSHEDHEMMRPYFVNP